MVRAWHVLALAVLALVPGTGDSAGSEDGAAETIRSFLPQVEVEPIGQEAEPTGVWAERYAVHRAGVFDGWVSVDSATARLSACEVQLLSERGLDEVEVSGWGSSSVNMPEARAIAKRESGLDLGAARMSLLCRAWPRQIQLRVDSDSASGAHRAVWMVDAIHGCLAGWVADRSDTPAGTPDRLTEEDALAKARDEAMRRLGPAAADLAWRVADSDGSSATVSGEGARVGDPPRGGLTASCWAQVSLVDGSVFAYAQTVGSDEEPLTPVVDAERARGIALEAAGAREGAVAADASLEQRDGRLYWVISIRGRADRRWHVALDAMTGEPLSVLGGSLKIEEEVRDAQGKVIGYRRPPLEPYARWLLFTACSATVGIVGVLVWLIWWVGRARRERRARR